MNPKIENVQLNEIEENISNNHKSTEKSNKSNLLIFICCIFLAFAVWCLSTPMTEQKLYVTFELEGALANEKIGPKYALYTFYGDKEVLEELATKNSEQNPIVISVKRDSFINPDTGEVLYDTPMDIYIKYSDMPFHSHDNEFMKFKLYISEGLENQNDQTSDK